MDIGNISSRTSSKISPYEYQQGFGNEFQTEALPNALPRGQNNPQRCPYELYAEQLSGSAFTTSRSHNLRTWMYRLQPSVSSFMHDHPWIEYTKDGIEVCFGACNWQTDFKIDPNPMRWGPPINNKESLEQDAVTFIHGLKTYAGAGDPTTKSGLAIYLYSFNTSMSTATSKESFYNSDGDFLIVPQQGTLKIQTELGILVVEPNEICVIPRGIVFRVDLTANNDCAAGQGYVLETFGGHFTLPEVNSLFVLVSHYVAIPSHSKHM